MRKYGAKNISMMTVTLWRDIVNIKTPERRTYTVDDIAQILGIGRTSAYILVKEGHFKIVRIGNAIRISKRSFDEWLDSLDL